MTEFYESNLPLISAEMLKGLRATALRLMPQAGSGDPYGYGLHVAHRVDKDACAHCFESPLCAITLQGRKMIRAGAYKFDLMPGSLLVTGVDMPSASFVLDASPDQPYLGFYVYLQRQILAELLLEMSGHAASDGRSPGACVFQANLDFLDVFRRFADLAARPERIPVLAPDILRELHYLLLLSPYGEVLRHLYLKGGKDNRITEVINWLRQHVASSASMESLARIAHMSVSSFHRHFKQITGLSPLQYHKKLRLHEAQRLMLGEDRNAAEAAFEVGYESITQFNREYRRLFGEPPGRDIASRKRKLAV